jgi:hypothetical protein
MAAKRKPSKQARLKMRSAYEAGTFETLMTELWPKVSGIMRSNKFGKNPPKKAYRENEPYTLHDDIAYGDVVSGTRIAAALIISDHMPDFYPYKTPSGKKRVAVYRSAKKVKLLKRAKCPCESK